MFIGLLSYQESNTVDKKRSGFNLFAIDLNFGKTWILLPKDIG